MVILIAGKPTPPFAAWGTRTGASTGSDRRKRRTGRKLRVKEASAAADEIAAELTAKAS